MSDFSVSFHSKTVVVEASYTLLFRWVYKALTITVLGLALLLLSSDAPASCDLVVGKANRMCKAALSP
jgi:hypothetical protein